MNYQEISFTYKYIIYYKYISSVSNNRVDSNAFYFQMGFENNYKYLVELKSVRNK